MSKSQNISIIYRSDSEDVYHFCQKITSTLEARSHKVTKFKQSDSKVASEAFKNNNPDMIIVVGGDGTYLSAVRTLNGLDTPILGVNFGSLGYLTETRKEDAEIRLEQYFSGKLEKRPRSLLQVQGVDRAGAVLFQKEVLNDIVLERGARPQLVSLEVKCNDKIVSTIKADGLIVSTPTGSTAYNLAAGGPILHPEASVFTVTPIAPHSLTSRPLVFPDSAVLSLEVLTTQNRAQITLDGRTHSTLNEGITLKVSKSPKTHFVLRDPNRNYFDILKEKLNFGERSGC